MEPFILFLQEKYSIREEKNKYGREKIEKNRNVKYSTVKIYQ